VEDVPLLQISFGTDDNAWNVLEATEVDDFVVDDLDHVEGVS